MPDVEAWLTILAEALPPGALDEIGSEERAVLLDLARIAAHRSHRSAAPITTYAIGLSVASVPRPVRLERMRELARILDRP
jgi:hypothetical protein